MPGTRNKRDTGDGKELTNANQKKSAREGHAAQSLGSCRRRGGGMFPIVLKAFFVPEAFAAQAGRNHTAVS